MLIGVALVTGTLLLTDAVGRSVRSLTAGAQAGVDVVVDNADDPRAGPPQAVRPQLARRASRVAPLEAIREAAPSTPLPAGRARAAVGLGLALAGAAGIAASLVVGTSATILSGLGALGALLGVMALGPVLVPPLCRAGGGLLVSVRLAGDHGWRVGSLVPFGFSEVLGGRRTRWRARRCCPTECVAAPRSSARPPSTPKGWTGSPACQRATSRSSLGPAWGEAAYRPLVERLAREAVASVEAGQVQIPGDYDLPEADLEALRGRLLEPGHRERTRMAYLDGVDGWIDDMIAMTRPWGFQLAQINVPVSVWYGPKDVLSPRGHAEWLIAHLPGAARRELPTSGHLLDDKNLDSLYAWLTAADA